MAETSADPARSLTDTCRWWVLAVVVDAFIVNVALPSVAVDLQAGPGEMEAVIAVYQAAYAALVITGGRLGDIYGRRPIFIAGVLSFTAASAWCGLAGSAAGLVLARLAQGIAAALMVPRILATLHVLFPGQGRSRAFAIFGIALGTGGAVGFLLGGWLVTLDPVGLGWRGIFLVNLPSGALVAFAAHLLMPPLPTRAASRLDLLGAILLFAGLIGLLGPVLVGGRLGWPWWLGGVAAGAVVVLLVFVAWQRRMAGLVAFGGLAAQTPDARLALALTAFGQGLVMAPLAGLVLGRAAPYQAGAASGLLNTVQQASGAVGVTAVGLVYAADGLEGGQLLLGASILGTAVLLVGWTNAAR